MRYDQMEHDVRKVVAGSNFIVADNSGYLRSLTRFALESYGAHSILEARDGAQVVDFLRLTHADALIMAWRMWPIDGPTTVCYLRDPANSPAPDLPIIVLSNRGDVADVGAARLLGVDGFLAWPLSARALCTGVAMAMVQAARLAAPPPRREPEYGDVGCVTTVPLLTFDEVRLLISNEDPDTGHDA